MLFTLTRDEKPGWSPERTRLFAFEEKTKTEKCDSHAMNPIRIALSS